MAELWAVEPVVNYSCKDRESTNSPLLCCVIRLLCGFEHSEITVSRVSVHEKEKLPVYNYNPFLFITGTIYFLTKSNDFGLQYGFP